MSMVDEARAFVIANHGQLRRVAAEAGLTYWWITKFSSGFISDPGTSKVEALLDLKARWDAERAA